MSLLDKSNEFNVWDYIFIAVGLLCVFGFFMSYPSQEPRSIIQTELNSSSAKSQAERIYYDLGYELDSQKKVTVQLVSNKLLLDSLQADFGRAEMIQSLSDSAVSGINPFYWEINYSDRKGETVFESSDNRHTIRLDEQGRLIEFLNSNNQIPKKSVNREALITTFQSDANLDLWRTLPDSAWNNVLRFEVDGGYSNNRVRDTANTVDSEAYDHTLSKFDINNLAKYHLKKSGWNVEQLIPQNIQVETVHSQTVADVTFVSASPIMGQDVEVNLQLLPTGTLLGLEATYNRGVNNGQFAGILDFARISAVLLFGFAVVILFFFRIRSRAIDTQSALVVGIVAGLIIPGMIFLERWRTTSLFFDNQSSDLLGLFFQMGFGGAFASIIFFTLFSVGDSLMRQYWPQKLYSYDYVRQGMMFNKPIGEMILRSIILAFVLCGIWAVGLILLPEISFEIERTFMVFEAAWSPLYLFLNSIAFSLSVTLIIFSIVGAQVYGFYKNKLFAGIIIVLGIILVAPVEQSVQPVLQQATIYLIMGVALTAIFIKWDLLTVFFSHLLFILMVKTSGGWIVEGSPDLYVFITFVGFIIFNLGAGILFISKGVTQQSLTGYVPEYVEELAQEERIKQELQIAREVQQSFLPTQKPFFKGLDMAAICKPAYETGGDYYDYIRLDDDRIAVAIGDVSGKGFQAAFYMTFIKGILHSLCREIDSPAEILKKVNRLFYDNAQRGTFISLVYGIIDLQKQTFTFARAGHNPILKVGSNRADVEELKPSGIGIGLSKELFDEQIKEVTLSLSEDELLILYTDGIVEALNEHHKFYGNDRFNKMVSKNAKKSAKQILDLLAHDVHSFIGEAKQHDDMTIMVIKLIDNE